MADIVKRDQGQQQQPARQQQQRRVGLDPIRMMRDMMRWDPFAQMLPFAGQEELWAPQFDVRENDNSFIFKADLPGIPRENVDIELQGNRLQISGKREHEQEDREGDTVYAYERSYGSFCRVFTLPENADTEHVSSDLKDGVLTLVVPKRPGEQPRKIQIGAKGQKS